MTTNFRIGVALGAFMVTLVIASGNLWAETPEQERVDVAVFELKGDGIDPGLLETLSGVLRREAQQHGEYALANPAAIQRDEIALIVGCDPQKTDCLRQMGQYVDGQVLIFGEVTEHAGGLVVSIDILDIDSGEDPIRVQRRIDDVTDPVVSFRREVEEIFDELESMGETHLVVEAPRDDMPIRLEGVVVGQGIVERRGMRPGVYHVAVGESGDLLWDDDVELVEGQLVEIRPEERPPSEAPQASAPPPKMEAQDSPVTPGRRPASTGAIDYDERRSNMGAYSLMGVGAALMAGGAVMAVLMRRVEGQIDEESEQGTLDPNRHNQLIDRGETYQNAQYVLLGVGIAAIGAGAGWTFFNSQSKGSDEGGMVKSFVVEPTLRGVSISGWW